MNAASRKRRDTRIRLTGGIDLSDAIGDWLPGVDFEIAGQFQRQWSNDETKEHSRAYFMPSVTLSKTFK